MTLQAKLDAFKADFSSCLLLPARPQQRALLRRFVLAAVAISIVATSASSVWNSAHAAPQQKLVMRDATRFLDNPDLSKYGLKNIEVVYEGSLWPAGASKAQPDLNYILKNYIPKVKGKKLDVLVIDIETWGFKPGMTSAQRTTNINKYKKVIDLFRRELPATKLGYYGVLPERNWLAPCGDPKKAASRARSWHASTQQLRTLVDKVDIVFPSLYTIYQDAKSEACWPEYARQNIAEAKTYGKPVWVFLWPKYKGGAKTIRNAFWRKQLEAVGSRADGIVLWTMASAREKFNPTTPWFAETRSFMKSKGLVK